MVNGLRLLVTEADLIDGVDGLRSLLTDRYADLFGTLQIQGDHDLSEVEDVIEVVRDAEQASDFSPVLSSLFDSNDPAPLLTWMQHVHAETPVTLQSKWIEVPAARALHLFLPGSPCVRLRELTGLTLELAEFRSSHPAFSGSCSVVQAASDSIRLHWDLSIEFVRLHVVYANRRAEVIHSSPDGKESFAIEANKV